MSTEELLMPRYKVINCYPSMDKHKLYYGAIIALDLKEGNQWYMDTGKSKIYDAYYDGYPHLFRKLQWWEDREIEDLPEYVRRINGKVMEVDHFEETSVILLETQKRYNIINFLPATREEYEAQLTH